MVGNRVDAVVVEFEVREDGKHHPGDARFASTSPTVVDPAVTLEPSVEKERAGLSRLPVARRQTKVAKHQHCVGRRDPFWRVKATVRRQPTGPRTFGVLPSEQTSP